MEHLTTEVEEIKQLLVELAALPGERRVASRQGSSGYELTGRPFTQVHQTCTASEAAAQGLVADAMPTATAKS
jgi:uncharacterized protein YcbX